MKKIVLIALLVLSCNVKADAINEATFCNMDRAIDEIKKRWDGLPEKEGLQLKVMFIRKTFSYCLQKKGFTAAERAIIYKSLMIGLSVGWEEKDYKEMDSLGNE